METKDSKTSKKGTRRKQYLTMKLLEDHPNGWETAIVYPLPPNPSYKLLKGAFLNALDFLYFNGLDVYRVSDNVAEILQEGFDKILEIALLLRDVPTPCGEEDSWRDEPTFSNGTKYGKKYDA